MIIPDYINDALITLGKNFTTSEYIVTAGAADYFNQKKLGVDINIVIGDIDIYISDEVTLRKMESIFNVKASLINEFDEQPFVFSGGFSGKSHITQYAFPNTCYDVYFLNNINRFNTIETAISDYKNIKMCHSLSTNTYLQLINALNYNYNISSQNKKIFKYLRKITIYNSLGYKLWL